MKWKHLYKVLCIQEKENMETFRRRKIRLIDGAKKPNGKIYGCYFFKNDWNMLWVIRPLDILESLQRLYFTFLKQTKRTPK